MLIQTHQLTTDPKRQWALRNAWPHLDMVTKPKNAQKCIKIYYIRNTCFGHSCSHPQGGVLRRIDHLKLKKKVLPHIPMFVIVQPARRVPKEPEYIYIYIYIYTHTHTQTAEHLTVKCLT